MNRICLSTIAAFLLCTAAVSAQTVALKLSNDPRPHTIDRNIYGHFAEHLGRCIYDGFWVSDTMKVAKDDRIRLDVIQALRDIQIPNLRWPGGCFADEYHWRDGIGPRAQRPKMVNTNWGGVTEDNSFGTHEFLRVCELLHCEPYIAGNVGSGTVEEMSKWIEYLNFDGISPMADLRKKNGHPAPWKVTLWGVGNESWGCGGSMRPEFYADQYRRYATYARNYEGARLKKIASGANSGDYNWTEVMMKNVPARMMYGLSLHYYTVPSGVWANKGSATTFTEQEYFKTMKNCLHMEELVNGHSAIMDKYDPDKKVALIVDEWGIWTDVEPGTNKAFLYQQNSLRDALVAGTTLNIFNNHSDRVRGANLAQTINVLQSVILTRGRQMLLTPTYYVFLMYKVHQDAAYLPLEFKSPDYNLNGNSIPALNISASKDSLGAIHISLVNLDPHRTISVQPDLTGQSWKTVNSTVLTSGQVTDVNTFEKPYHVKPITFKDYSVNGSDLNINLPPRSIVMMELK